MRAVLPAHRNGSRTSLPRTRAAWSAGSRGAATVVMPQAYPFAHTMEGPSARSCPHAEEYPTPGLDTSFRFFSFFSSSATRLYSELQYAFTHANWSTYLGSLVKQGIHKLQRQNCTVRAKGSSNLHPGRANQARDAGHRAPHPPGHGSVQRSGKTAPRATKSRISSSCSSNVMLAVNMCFGSHTLGTRYVPAAERLKMVRGRTA